MKPKGSASLYKGDSNVKLAKVDARNRPKLFTFYDWDCKCVISLTRETTKNKARWANFSRSTQTRFKYKNEKLMANTASPENQSQNNGNPLYTRVYCSFLMFLSIKNQHWFLVSLILKLREEDKFHQLNKKFLRGFYKGREKTFKRHLDKLLEDHTVIITKDKTILPSDELETEYIQHCLRPGKFTYEMVPTESVIKYGPSLAITHSYITQYKRQKGKLPTQRAAAAKLGLNLSGYKKQLKKFK